MEEHGGKWLFAVSAMALTIGALIYLLFAEHPVSQSSPSPEPISSAPSQLPAVPPQPVGRDETRSCGRWDPLAPPDPLTDDRALSRLGAKLALSPVEGTGAMGLFLQRLTVSQEFIDARPGCESDMSCRQTAAALGAIRESQYENALIGMASRTRDPQIYALAFFSCGYQGGYGASGCALVSAEQWARIEPDNGMPWLLVAQAARDEVGRDNAIRRAASAHSFDAHLPDFLGLMRAPELRNETPEIRSDLAVDLFSMQLLLPTPHYGLFLRFCNYPAVADASRIDACNNLTRLLLEHDKTMAGFSAGVRLAESANWPADRVESLRQEKKSYMAALGRKGVLQEPANTASACGMNFESRTTNYEFLGDLGVAKSLAE